MPDAYPQFGLRASGYDPLWTLHSPATMQYGLSVLVRSRLGYYAANLDPHRQLTVLHTKILARECPGLLATFRLTLACEKDKVAIG
jgi:hypothetical protein